MNILVIANGYPTSRNPQYCVYIKRQVDALESLGLARCTVLSAADDRKGITRTIYKYLRLISQTFYHMGCGGFDLVVAHMEFPAGLIAILPKLVRRKKLLITVHGGVFNGIEDRSPYFQKLICLILHKADQIVAVSAALREKIFQVCPGLNVDISVIDMGVATDVFRPLPKQQAREGLGIHPQSGQRMLLFVGNLITLKGVAILLRALQILLSTQAGLAKAQLFLVGDGPERKNLENEASQLGIIEHVHFVGRKLPDEIPVWMAAADILIMPSLDEGFGLVALESMACGTPVIASRVGGLREFVLSEETGLTVLPGDAGGIAEQVDRLLQDKVLYERLVKNGLQQAAKYSTDLRARAYYHLYEQLCS